MTLAPAARAKAELAESWAPRMATQPLYASSRTAKVSTPVPKAISENATITCTPKNFGQETAPRGPKKPFPRTRNFERSARGRLGLAHPSHRAWLEAQLSG